MRRSFLCATVPSVLRGPALWLTVFSLFACSETNDNAYGLTYAQSVCGEHVASETDLELIVAASCRCFEVAGYATEDACVAQTRQRIEEGHAQLLADDQACACVEQHVSDIGDLELDIRDCQIEASARYLDCMRAATCDAGDYGNCVRARNRDSAACEVVLTSEQIAARNACVSSGVDP